MGCVSSKKLNPTTKTREGFISNRPLGGTIFKEPLESTLYNMLRRSTSLLVLQQEPNSCQLNKAFKVPFSGVSPEQVEEALKSKHVLVIGDHSSLQSSKLAESFQKKEDFEGFIIEAAAVNSFMNSFRLFLDFPRQPRDLPIMVFDSTDLTAKPSETTQIFIHSALYRNDDVYTKVSINNVVKLTVEDLKVRQDWAKDFAGKRSVILHQDQVKLPEIQNKLIGLLSEHYQLNPRSVEEYLKRQISHSRNNTVLNFTAPTKPLKERLCDLFQSYSKVTKQGNVESCSSFLSTLVNNICENPTQTSMRRVRSENKRMQELFSVHPTGLQLLSECGFNLEGQYWVNNTDVKYLKIYQTDLALAYKEFCNKNKPI